MADGIGRIFGGNNYGVGGFISQRKNEEGTDTQTQGSVQPNYEETQVDPNKVMDFLANNNYFIPVKVEANPVSGTESVDSDTEERIAAYMERFEQIYSIVEQEFGPELSPAVMDLVMDKLMGMA